MTAAESVFCTTCLRSHTNGETWFLLLENNWTDRLKIIGWNEKLALHPKVHTACCTAHVQQLVVHWMTTGTLDYPFARARFSEMERATAPNDVPGPRSDPDTTGATLLGELAVHRESLERILIENPQSLGSLLAALNDALRSDEIRRGPKAHKRFEEETCSLVNA